MNDPSTGRRTLISFLIPLRARGTDAAKWDLTCKLFRNTLRSLLRQTDPDWVAYIACRDIPDFGERDEESP